MFKILLQCSYLLILLVPTSLLTGTTWPYGHNAEVHHNAEKDKPFSFHGVIAKKSSSKLDTDAKEFQWNLPSSDEASSKYVTGAVRSTRNEAGCTGRLPNKMVYESRSAFETWSRESNFDNVQVGQGVLLAFCSVRSFLGPYMRILTRGRRCFCSACLLLGILRDMLPMVNGQHCLGERLFRACLGPSIPNAAIPALHNKDISLGCHSGILDYFEAMDAFKAVSRNWNNPKYQHRDHHYRYPVMWDCTPWCGITASAALFISTQRHLPLNYTPRQISI